MSQFETLLDRCNLLRPSLSAYLVKESEEGLKLRP